MARRLASIIYARRAIAGSPVGEWLWYDGKKFTNNNAPKYFGTRARARVQALRLVRLNPVLRNYRIYVGNHSGRILRAARENPYSRPEGLAEATRRLKNFSGHGVRRVIKVAPRSPETTGLVIGELDLIGYRASRVGVDGGKVVSYDHDFLKPGSRPLLAVSSDGKQLHIVGGRYEFTDAGIEDR